MRFLNRFLKRPLFLLELVSDNLKAFRGDRKKIMIQFRYDYFVDVGLEIFKELSTEYDLIISCPKDIDRRDLEAIDYTYISMDSSPYILNIDFFLSFEISGVDFPSRFIRCHKIQLFHGLGSYNVRKSWNVLKSFDSFFIPNKFFRPLLNCSEDQIFSFGYPKFDTLLKNCEDIKLNREKLYYIPHWDENSSLFNNHREVIKKIKDLRLDSYIIPHKYLFHEFKEDQKIDLILEDFERAGIKLLKEQNLNDLISSGEIIVCDIHSSTCIEASLTPNKPLYIDTNVLKDKVVEKVKEANVNFFSDYELSNFREEKGDVQDELVYNKGCSIENLLVFLRRVNR